MSLDYYIKNLIGKYEDKDMMGNPITLYNKIVDGDYQFDIIEEKKGGMANVYIGTYRHNDLEGQCIIKVLNPMSLIGVEEESPKFIAEAEQRYIIKAYESFTREAEILAKIKEHRKIDGLPYIEKQFTDNSIDLQRNLGFKNIYPALDKLTTGIVIEYLHGKDFKEIADFMNHFNLKMDDKIINYAISELCEPLNNLHNLRLIHKDIKPSNIHLSGKDIFLLDFGISSKIREKNNRVEGTLGYIPPKEFIGTVKGDIYQTGMVWAVLRTGNQDLPYEVQPTVVSDPNMDKAKELIKVPRKEKEIIFKCLNGEFGSAHELGKYINKNLDIATEEEVQEFYKECQPDLIKPKKQKMQSKTSMNLSQMSLQ